MKAPGPQKPRRELDELENARRSRYFFLAAFFLAAGFLAAFFFAAMLVYLLHLVFGPDDWFGPRGSNAFLRKVCRLARVVASVMASTSSIAYAIVVIPEQPH